MNLYATYRQLYCVLASNFFFMFDISSRKFLAPPLPTPLVLEGEGIGRTTGRGGGLLDGARHPVYMGLGLACEENMGSIVRYHP